MLDEPGSCHFVLGGEAMLFAVRDASRSARHPVARIPDRGLLFGMPAGQFGDEKIIAVPGPGARFYQLPPAGWRTRGPTAAFVAGVAVWLRNLADGLTDVVETDIRPLVVRPATAGPVAFAAGAVIGGGGEIVWVELPADGARLCGIEPVQGLLPLPVGLWLTLAKPVEIRVLGWDAGFARDDWPAALDAFHIAVAELLPLARGFAETDEANRLRTRQAEEEHDAFQGALRIADILANPLPPRSEADGGDGLMDVMRIIGREIGASVRRPVKARRAQMDLAPTLEDIARASDIRLQPVQLAEGWWTAEAAPMLARRTDDTPIALIWRGHRWQEYDPSGAGRPVAAAEAAGIAAAAHAVFRPLPARSGFATLFGVGVAAGLWDIAPFLAALVAGSAIGQILPLATGFIYGVLVPAALQNAVLQVGLVILGVGLAGFLVQLIGEAARQRIAARGDGRLHEALWDRIVGLPLAALRGHASADLGARVSAAQATVSGARQFIFQGVGTGATMLSSMAFLFWHDPRLAAFALALVAFLVAAGILAGWLQARAIRDGEQLQGTADSQMAEFVNGIAAVRSAGAETRATRRWVDRFVALRARQVAARRIMNIYEGWLAAWPGIAGAALLAIIHTVSRGADGTPGIPVASVAAILASFSLMLLALSQLLRGGLAVWLLRSSWAYARPLVEMAPEPTAGLSDPGRLEGEIEFSSIGFAYGGGPAVLADVSFRAAPGEMVAIVGPSGSGKSTLVRLLLGLETPSHGAVYVDGHDVRALHPEAYRRQIGVVLQDGQLPPGTIFEIVRGETNATVEEIWQALAAAAMAADVSAMPLGLHTLLLDASRTLSGGQIQRLALAGALLAKPPILVLDEATSALDNATQAQVMASVQAMPSTRILIAHRISTIRRANRILVLEHGRIVENGSFAELMERKGRLWQLASLSAT
ncbi:ATP-binding cassette domain-containing protein [Ancylobacter oerskovii]|nr:ATP-binding cassette domain-containing protein [Ancylobacter oerskovii]